MISNNRQHNIKRMKTAAYQAKKEEQEKWGVQPWSTPLEDFTNTKTIKIKLEYTDNFDEDRLKKTIEEFGYFKVLEISCGECKDGYIPADNFAGMQTCPTCG